MLERHNISHADYIVIFFFMICFKVDFVPISFITWNIYMSPAYQFKGIYTYTEWVIYKFFVK